MTTEHDDLQWLACRAALELDQLIAGRATTFDSVRRFADHLEVLGHADADRDATTSYALLHAIADVRFVERVPERWSDFVVVAGNVRHGLRELTSASTTGPSSESLRDLCLAFSRRASRHLDELGERSDEHPFRS